MRIRMKKSRHTDQPVRDRWLDIDEIRLISDLRVMHAKVDELYQIVANLKRRHSGADIHKYADQPEIFELSIYSWTIGTTRAADGAIGDHHGCGAG